MKLAALVLSALALVIVGCGSSDDDSLSKAEFIKQADALCKKADEKEAREFAAYARNNASELTQVGGEGVKKATRAILVPSIRNGIEEMKALGIPEDDEDQLRKFFDEVEVGLKKAEEDPLSIQQNGPQSPLFGAFKRGQAYGFKLCNGIY